jgi:hypothetical protein
VSAAARPRFARRPEQNEEESLILRAAVVLACRFFTRKRERKQSQGEV